MFFFKFKKQKNSQQDNEFVDKEIKKIPKVISIIFFVYIVLFLALMIWLFYFKATYYISPVQGTSMQPTINPDIVSQTDSTDFVYVNSRKAGTYGDIVTIDVGAEKPIIKRIIGTQGDLVSIYIADDGYYHVAMLYKNTRNVVVLNEDYIKSYSLWTSAREGILQNEVIYEKQFYDTFLNGATNLEIIDGVLFYEIPENFYFCLGDNRAVSSDSRSRGVFNKDQIKGVAEIIVKDGNINSGWLLGKKISAISAYYWEKIENSFAR